MRRDHTTKDRWVYILRNPNGLIYVGRTSDLGRRINEHSQHRVKATATAGPWKLVMTIPLHSDIACTVERDLRRLLASRPTLQKPPQPTT